MPRLDLAQDFGSSLIYDTISKQGDLVDNRNMPTRGLSQLRMVGFLLTSIATISNTNSVLGWNRNACDEQKQKENVEKVAVPSSLPPSTKPGKCDCIEEKGLCSSEMR